MKLVAVLLLLFNLLGLAFWQGWLPLSGAVPTQVRQSFTPAPQPLVLLSELAPEQLTLMQEVAEARERVGSAQARLATAEQEALVTREQLVEGQGEEARLEPAATVLQPWCATAGAFPDEQAAVGFRSAIVDLGGKGLLVSKDEPVSSTWWVYLPAFSSEAEARTVLAVLQEKRIDSYYMRTGELVGGISLGVFSREESANLARQQLAGRGYQASIKQIFRYEPRFYVEIELPDEALRRRPEWSRTETYLSGLQYTENACQVIAP
jgi:hypothetical protein